MRFYRTTHLVYAAPVCLFSLEKTIWFHLSVKLVLTGSTRGSDRVNKSTSAVKIHKLTVESLVSSLSGLFVQPTSSSSSVILPRPRGAPRARARARDRARPRRAVRATRERVRRPDDLRDERSEGRSIQSDGGVEFKGVRWSSKASRAGIETEGWAERCAGQSP